MTQEPNMSLNEMAEACPCPFCGGEDIRFTNHGVMGRSPFHDGDHVWSMCCYKCGATFPNMYRKEALLEKWNTRALSALGGRSQGGEDA